MGIRCVILLIAATAFTGLAGAEPSRTWFDGGDLSALGEIEKAGGRFKNRSGESTDAIQSLASFGANCVRLRLFVNPNGKHFVVNDLQTTLALAKRAKAAGQEILLDFHYSDTWADPGAQVIPASWTDHSLESLSAKVASHTYDTLRTFDEAGLFPAMVQIGNEIDNGMLWPTGRLFKKDGGDPDWDSLATLLKSASEAVRRATPEGKRIRIVVHTAEGGNASKCKAYHQAMKDRGLDYDVIGLSFYPWWHGGIDGMKHNLTQLASTTGKEILIAEAAYPWNEGNEHQKFHGMKLDWPQSPEGQQAYLRDVIRAVRELPENKGIGVMWWHPDSIAVKDRNVWMAGSCAMWKPDGTCLPALECFREP